MVKGKTIMSEISFLGTLACQSSYHCRIKMPLKISDHEKKPGNGIDVTPSVVAQRVHTNIYLLTCTVWKTIGWHPVS